MKKVSSLAIILVLGLLAGLVAAACGGGAEPTATPTTPAIASTPTQVVVAPTATPSPKLGGVLKVRDTGDPPSMDAAASPSYRAQRIASMVYNRLVKLASGPDVPYATMEAVPDLAESWEHPDTLTYIFHLRKGIKWPNESPYNGRELNAEDVKFSIERQGTKGFAQAWIVADVASVVVLDNYTVKVTLKGPQPDFLSFLAYGLWVVPIEAKTNEELITKTPNGTGPFKLDTWDKNVILIYSANADYWEGRPYLNEVEHYVVPDAAAALASFRTKQLDILSINSYSQVRELKPAFPELIWGDILSLGDAFQVQMKNVPPYDNVNVRRAMSYALDKDLMLQAGYEGQAVRSGFISPAWADAVPGVYTSAEWAQKLPFDLEKAKRLMRDAGMEQGFKDTIKFYAGYGPQMEIGATMVKEQLAAINIDLTLEPVEYAGYAQTIYGQHIFTIAFGVQTGYPTVSAQLRSMWQRESRNIGEFYFDDLIAKIDEYATGLDPAKRAQDLRWIQDYLVEQSAIIYSAAGKTWSAQWPYVKNYYVSRDPGFYNQFAKVWLDK